jgi:hypothetical protein
MAIKPALTPFALATILLVSAAHAQTPTVVDEVPPPPPVVSGETLEPDVTIVQGEDRTVREYRVNGQLRAVRIEPDNGPAYYLVDGDGDGRLDTENHIYGPGFWINSWVLFSWD